MSSSLNCFNYLVNVRERDCRSVLKKLKMKFYVLCSVDRAFLHNLMNETNMVHSILSIGPKHVEVINKTDELYREYCAPCSFHLQEILYIIQTNLKLKKVNQTECNDVKYKDISQNWFK